MTLLRYRYIFYTLSTVLRAVLGIFYLYCVIINIVGIILQILHIGKEIELSPISKKDKLVLLFWSRQMIVLGKRTDPENALDVFCKVPIVKSEVLALTSPNIWSLEK